MDKNSITGFVLIALLIFGFSWYNQKNVEETGAWNQEKETVTALEDIAGQMSQDANYAEIKAASDISVDSAALASQFGAFASSVRGTAQTIALENEVLSLTFSTKGGKIQSALLKDYKTYEEKPVILFEENTGNYSFTFVTANQRVITTDEMYFDVIQNKEIDGNQVLRMRLNAGNDAFMDFVYTIAPGSYVINFNIEQKNIASVLSPSSSAANLIWTQDLRRQEKGRVFEERYSNLYYKYLNDDVDYLKADKDQRETITGSLKWIGFKNQFFSSVMIAKTGFSNAVLDSKVIKDGDYLKKFRSEAEIEVNTKEREMASFDFFFGPNLYPLLREIDKQYGNDSKLKLDKLVPLGASVFRWVNVYIVIPVFTFLGKYISNYGIIILLLTIFIKMIIFPFTFKSYLSQAKMRVVRPEIQEINDKYPGTENQMKRQQETMALYSKAGINPMGGCLPMLFQMPILFAMFQFFPSSIELRGESFLWAKDLSSYDSIVSWNTYIPLITPYFGNHISLFCLLMTATNLIYIHLSMSANTMNQPGMGGMKVMQYMMPVMFMVFFNNYAAGLSYYYFVSLLITIGQTYMMRLFVNEEKMLAQMKANAKKPKKKTGFMARLEEAQRQQQAAMRQQQKNKK